MIQYAIRRLVMAIPTLFLMLTVVFVLVRMVPGDPAVALLGDQATAASLATLRAQLGLDQPLHVQYLHFMGDVLTGDLGSSMTSGRTVLHEVALVLPYTLELTAAALVIGSIFGLPLGIVAALYRNAWPDYLSRILSLIGLSFPAFVSGILLLLGLAVSLRWFPVINTGASSFTEHMRNLALPALNLGLIMTAYIARISRASVLNVLGEDFVRTARAKGLRPFKVVRRHVMRNALIPVVTIVGLYFGTLIGNSVLTEIVFTRPGLGSLILGALTARDYTLLQGLMVVFATFVVLVNTITDLVYGLVDPRIKYS